MFFASKKNTPDTEIITGICGGIQEKRKAENLLFEKYHYLVKDGLRKHKLSEDECVSIYSDTIMAIIENILKNKFEGRAELKTYIYQIFSNKCVDQIRKNTTNKAAVNHTVDIENLSFQLPVESKSIIQKLMAQSDIDKLYHQLATVGEKCKQMILLWGEGYSDNEIALQLAYQSAAVAKTSRIRCLDKLKEKYLH
jgi:RNA polymerase sigma factor (sigma-70 family)